MSGAGLFPDSRWKTNVWQAPLVPVALCVTGGIVVDRQTAVPLPVSLVFLAICLLSCLALCASRRTKLSLIYLLLAAAAFGSAYHRWWQDAYPIDHIVHYVGDEPQIARIRGNVIAETVVEAGSRGDPLRSFDAVDRSTTLLEATELMSGSAWQTVSGKVRLRVWGSRERFAVGSAIEVIGWLSVPEPPANPGEFDHASFLRDRRIRAVVDMEYADGAFSFPPPNSSNFIDVCIGRVRAWGRQVLNEHLAPDEASIAAAILLGDRSALDRADWDKYTRTGVIHVLVVSGQHLVVIAAFLWCVLRLGWSAAGTPP